MQLLPPVARGDWPNLRVAIPLTEGPRYVRTPGMGRWHRIRSGYQVRDESRGPSWRLWCGQHIGYYGVFEVDEPPAGEPACGTCEGRAIGAGQVENPLTVDLAYEPWMWDTPTLCPGPGRGLYVAEGFRVGRCLVCQLLAPTRVTGGPYRAQMSLTKHPPGPGLMTPCPFHGWFHLRAVDGAAVCWPCRTDD
ncbi:hypothetical protein [Parafrankia sp. EUN1f]|uniref:hypothetical protein n=1 Tax=Parafrankia sp. EUN1f TaxID=102897 RepID=UPI0012FA86B5|nr:hypothetical protein [Parafrankia sp. EUN1f]